MASYVDRQLRKSLMTPPNERTPQPASEAGAAGGGGPEAGAAGGGGSGDATGSTVSEDPAADVDDAPPEEGEGSAKKQKLTGPSQNPSVRLGERAKLKLGRALTDSDSPLFVDALRDQGRVAWRQLDRSAGKVTEPHR
ncbi:hypothetical protein Bbelb_010890 [Branchiostoma belcheri]|nr:hypothetical protein Bbelb_010890 [Branchiostoma belcheri]